MKYFFTAGLQNANGEDVSNTSVKDAIQELIATALNASSEDEATSPSRQQEPRPL